MRKLALLFSLPVLAHATCAIAVWTPERIVLGADSQETVVNPDRGKSSFEACKIRQIGAFYVIISGITEHRRTGFNVWGILSESVRGTDSVLDAGEKAAAEIARRYADVLQSARETGANAYLRGLRSNAPAFAIAGFSRGAPYLVHYRYDFVRNRWIWRKDIFARSSGDRMGLAYLCDPRGVQRYKRSHPGWRTEDPAKTVSGMIAETSRIDPTEVGGATSVMVMEKSGARWVNPGMCR